MMYGILKPKRNFSRGILLLGAAVLLAGGGAWAAEQEGGMPGDWLTSYRSARAIGLGGAFTAVADQPLGMLWNPAGMTQLEMNEVFLESTRLFEDTTVNGLSFVAPGSRYPTLGVSILALRSGEFQKTSTTNDDLGDFREKETAFVLSASHDLASYLSLGGNLRVVRQSIDDFSSSGFGFDLGAMARLTPDLRLGASVLNLGGPSITLRNDEENYPVQWVGGASLDLMQDRALIAFELVQVDGLELTARGGAELAIGANVSLRAGFDKTSPAGGFSYRLPNQMQVDYGAIGHELGITHRFGISWRFGGFFADSQAQPAVFSPLGRNATTSFQLSSRTRRDTESWRLSITDRYGDPVRTFGGRGTPPAQVVWDGKSDRGEALPDGSYLYHLAVTDAGGRSTEGPLRTIQINSQIQEISVPIQLGAR